jgi:hypothetical protein
MLASRFFGTAIVAFAIAALTRFLLHVFRVRLGSLETELRDPVSDTAWEARATSRRPL